MKTKPLVLAAVLIAIQGQVRADEGFVASADPFAVKRVSSATPVDGHDAAHDRVRPLRFVNVDQDGGWRLGKAVYVGRRPGDLGGFGVKWRAGATELALTHEGVGWRLRF